MPASFDITGQAIDTPDEDEPAAVATVYSTGRLVVVSLYSADLRAFRADRIALDAEGARRLASALSLLADGLTSPVEAV